MSDCSCGPGKRSYTKGRARFEVARRNKVAGAVVWNAYRCPFARGVWHLGHIPPTSVPLTREGQREMAERRKARRTREKDQ